MSGAASTDRRSAWHIETATSRNRNPEASIRRRDNRAAIPALPRAASRAPRARRTTARVASTVNRSRRIPTATSRGARATAKTISMVRTTARGRASKSPGASRTRSGQTAERKGPGAGLFSLRAFPEKSLLLALPVPILLRFALVMLLLALREADRDLHATLVVMQVDRHQRVAALLDLADELADLFRVEQELARARGIRAHVG